ncbi:unnamed protein product [Effrenium voratum]|uniref:Peptidase S54 rhomboid domain-containing protein n=1 Tax=Effrenium voratum TaxID=2562239 RepID=A0AA36MRV3_9DINO|nr:unnamed protein product [Effrenium voratum]
MNRRFTECCDWIGAKQDACSSFFSNICTCGSYRLVFNAPLTLWFEGLCLLVWALKLTKTPACEWPRAARNKFIAELFRSPARFEAKHIGRYPLTVPRLVLHIFGHGNWEHFLGNTTSLLLVLPMLEEKYKVRWLATISLLNAVVAAVVTMIMSEWTVVLGASGIVFQCMLLAVFSGRYHAPGDIPITFLLAVAVYIVPEVRAWGTDDGVSHTAHLVGGIVGAAAAFCARGHARTPDEVQRSQARMSQAPARTPAVQMTWRTYP